MVRIRMKKTELAGEPAAQARERKQEPAAQARDSFACAAGSQNRLCALAYVLLAAYLIFAHGCHADADTELFTVISESASAEAGR